MGYRIEQINHRESDGNGFIVPITTGEAGTFPYYKDSQMRDSYVYGFELSPGSNYYFKGFIKKKQNPQVFEVALLQVSGETKEAEQYIKTITIEGQRENAPNWVCVEFLFTPVLNFNSIIFKLNRNQSGDGDPVIIYQELASIVNIIPNKTLSKIGVQANPGVMMCINGEEIRMSRTGLYEIRNGVIPVTFFSVVHGDNSSLPAESATTDCHFGDAHPTTIDAFILDYMYKENEQGGNS